jgi:hypothetical protein
MPVSREPVCSVCHQDQSDWQSYIDWFLGYDGFNYRGLYQADRAAGGIVLDLNLGVARAPCVFVPITSCIKINLPLCRSSTPRKRGGKAPRIHWTSVLYCLHSCLEFLKYRIRLFARKPAILRHFSQNLYTDAGWQLKVASTASKNHYSHPPTDWLALLIRILEVRVSLPGDPRYWQVSRDFCSVPVP